MSYLVINRETLAIHHFGGGLTEAGIVETAGRDGAESLAEAEAILDSTPNPAEFEIVSSWEYNNRLGNLTNLKQAYERLVSAHNNSKSEAERLRRVIEAYLTEGVEGSLDPEDFMRETEALAEAIGYDWMTETELTVTATVTVKHRRNAEGALDESFSIYAETTSWGIAESVEITDYTVEAY